MQWEQDILDPGYDATTLNMGKDPDTGKNVRAVLVRATEANAQAQPGKPALIWVHGLSLIHI